MLYLRIRDCRRWWVFSDCELGLPSRSYVLKNRFIWRTHDKLVVFWALRGGGAGSWGVIISTTFRVYPTFSGVYHSIHVALNNSIQVGELAELHARHIFDWDSLKAGQYFYTTRVPLYAWDVVTFFPKATIEKATGAMQPFVDGIHSLGFTSNISVELRNVNDLLGSSTTDLGGSEVILGSRLLPETVYRNDTVRIGRAYTKLYDSGVRR